MFATIDIETTGLNRFKDDITWIGVQINQSISDEFGEVRTFDYAKKSERREFVELITRLKKQKAKLVRCKKVM